MAEFLKMMRKKQKKEEKSKMQKYKVLAFLLLSLLTLPNVCNATTITPPAKIELEGGEEDSQGNWKGGYWTFTVAVDQMDSFAGKVTLPANTTVNRENGEKVKTKKTVEITIKPVKSYYRRTLTLAPIEDRIVAPETYRGLANKFFGYVEYDKRVSIPATVVEYYMWASSAWEKYTVFEVSVSVDGKIVGSTTMNTECGRKEVVVTTSKGSVLIKNLGRLEGDFSEPHTPEVVIFNEKYIFASEAIKYLRYDHGATYVYWPEGCSLCYIEGSNAYSTFWFGRVRWSPQKITDKNVAGSPAPFKKPNPFYDILPPEKGWKSSDDFWSFIRDPVAPPIFPEQGNQSLIWYLNKMTSEGNIANKWLTGYNWYLEKKDGKPQAVIVEIPWGAYSGAPVVTFFVPTELAETWVYVPPISDARIQSVRWLDGSEIDASRKKKCEVELKQFSRVTSSSILVAEISTSRASVSPNFLTITMEPNETKKVVFEVTNLGVSAETEGRVFFTVKRSWDGVVTSTAYLSFKLLPPALPENTMEIVDRSKSKLDQTSQNSTREQGDNTWVWVIGIVCVTSVIVTIALIVRDERRRRKAMELAKAAAKESKKIAKEVTKPVWRRYGYQISMILVGIASLFLGLIFLKSLIFAKVFHLGIIDIKLGPWTLASIAAFDLLLSCIICIVGVVFIIMGVGSLIKSIVRSASQTAPVKLITKQLTDYFKNKEEE